MSLLDRLLAQLKERGLSVGPGDNPGELKLHGPRTEVTTEIMRALKAFKPQLLKQFVGQPPEANPEPPPVPAPMPQPEPAPEKETCEVCDREVDAEDRERLRGVNPFCSEGGARKAFTDGNGVFHAERPPCPYREREKLS